MTPTETRAYLRQRLVDDVYQPKLDVLNEEGQATLNRFFTDYAEFYYELITAYNDGDVTIFTDAMVRATALTGFAATPNSAIVDTDTVLSAFGKTQAQINSLISSLAGKENTIAAASPNPSTKYWDGNKTWQVLDTYAVAEHSSNLYFTEARVRATVLTGLDTSTPTGLITSADSVLSAFGRIQNQLNNKFGTSTLTANRLAIVDNSSKITTDANLTYTASTNVMQILGTRMYLGRVEGAVSSVDYYTADINYASGGTYTMKLNRLNVTTSSGVSPAISGFSGNLVLYNRETGGTDYDKLLLMGFGGTGTSGTSNVNNAAFYALNTGHFFVKTAISMANRLHIQQFTASGITNRYGMHLNLPASADRVVSIRTNDNNGSTNTAWIDLHHSGSADTTRQGCITIHPMRQASGGSVGSFVEIYGGSFKLNNNLPAIYVAYDCCTAINWQQSLSAAAPTSGINASLAVRGYADSGTANTTGSSTADVFRAEYWVSGTTWTSVFRIAYDNKIGFFNATPVVKQSALTSAISTGTILSCSNPGTQLTSITFDDSSTIPVFGFSSSDMALSTIKAIANLQTRVKELETRLQAYGLLA